MSDATIEMIQSLVNEGHAVEIKPGRRIVLSGIYFGQPYIVTVRADGLTVAVSENCSLVDAMSDAYQSTPESL